MAEQKTKTEPDSKTVVYQRLHGERTTMTVRVLPRLKKDFTEATRQLGLSTCHVVEGLLNGWLYGLNENLALVHQSPTINMTLVREVKRARRYAVEEVEKSVEYGHSLTTAYCPLVDRTNLVEDLSCLCKESPGCVNRACFERVLMQTEEVAQPQRNDSKLERALGHMP
jgi:hypothetical protein